MPVWAWVLIGVGVVVIAVVLVWRWAANLLETQRRAVLAAMPKDPQTVAREQQERQQEYARAFNDTAREYQDLLGKVTNDDDLYSDVFRADLRSQLVRAAMLQAAAPNSSAQASSDQLVEHMLEIWTRSSRSSRLADLYGRNRADFLSAVLKLSSG